MKQKTFKFDPGLWFKNRSLRSCSPAARGFFVDLLCLMHPTGYLVINEHPMDDKQIARLTGETVSTVRKLIAELGGAGIFSISEDGRLFSSRMVKEHQFSQNAKVSGARGQIQKKSKIQTKTTLEKIVLGEIKPKIGTTISIRKPSEYKNISSTMPEPEIVQPPSKPKKHVDWWKTNAGWARKGVEQAISIQPNEDVEDFKLRIAQRLGDGLHVEGLTERNQKRMKAQIEKELSYMPNAKDKN